MPKASEVALELRTMADRLDREPDVIIKQADLWFWHGASAIEKESFLNLVRAMPRPVTKTYEEGTGAKLIVKYKTPAIVIEARIDRSAVCEIVEPAKPAVYRCEPLLSDDEEASLTEV